MLRPLGCCVLAVLAVSFAPPLPLGRAPAAGGRPAAARQMAVTLDDLPGASATHSDYGFFERVNRDLIAAFARHRVPAIGFVNESKLTMGGAPPDSGAALLQLWIDAGLELGNHTYSHADLHATAVEDFTRDTLRGEAFTRRLLEAAGRRPRFFRHPFLHTGRDAASRRAFETFLREHGYTVAPVTVDNYDYMFARAYDRAGTDGDPSRQQRIVDAYLDYMTRVVAYYEAQSLALFDREIAQVLLLHVNALNARTFDTLAGILAARGYSFVPLETAIADPAYRSPDEYFGAGGITWLHRWALTAGKRGAFFAGEPVVPPWIAKAGQ
jgi:peptidoglycan/xylan/chitin deacetylase (PgdA/CDA1 family)